VAVVAVVVVRIPTVHQDAEDLVLYLLLIALLMIAQLIHPHQATTQQ
jgi:hypothetical protein